MANPRARWPSPRPVSAPGSPLPVSAEQNALHDWETAVDRLPIAEPDEGGHRETAIDYGNQAIEQVNLGIQLTVGGSSASGA